MNMHTENILHDVKNYEVEIEYVKRDWKFLNTIVNLKGKSK